MTAFFQAGLQNGQNYCIWKNCAQDYYFDVNAPLQSGGLFALGTALIGFGSALFLCGTLASAMEAAGSGRGGLALGTWGAVQSFAAGLAILGGGILHDVVGALGRAGALGEALRAPATGYGAVYATEIVLLFVTLVAIGPLAAFRAPVLVPVLSGTTFAAPSLLDAAQGAPSP